MRTGLEWMVPYVGCEHAVGCELREGWDDYGMVFNMTSACQNVHVGGKALLPSDGSWQLPGTSCVFRSQGLSIQN